MAELSKRIAFIDFEGTIVSHQSPFKRIPMMPELLSRLKEDKWKVIIVSSYSRDRIIKGLLNLEIDWVQEDILSSAGSSKGEVIKQYLENARLHEVIYKECIFVDDKPSNLDSVLQSCGDMVRIIGFVGSRKYTPEISSWCARHHKELALSPVDLAHGLPVYFCVDGDNLSKYSNKELAELLPGTDNPFHPFCGDGSRAIPNELFYERKLLDFSDVWRNIGWIQCSDCMWRIFEVSVLLSEGFSSREISSVSNLLPQIGLWDPSLRSAFKRAFNVVMEGVEQIGFSAIHCRLKDRPVFNENHWESLERQIEEAFKIKTEKVIINPSTDLTQDNSEIPNPQWFYKNNSD